MRPLSQLEWMALSSTCPFSHTPDRHSRPVTEWSERMKNYCFIADPTIRTVNFSRWHVLAAVLHVSQAESRSALAMNASLLLHTLSLNT